MHNNRLGCELWIHANVKFQFSPWFLWLSYFVLFHSWLHFIPFQPHRSVKWRLAFLAASFSMILSVASSEELKASRSNLKKALKTESENHLGNPRTVNPNDPKTIDYTLYNYGKFLLQPHISRKKWGNYSENQHKKYFPSLSQIRLISKQLEQWIFTTLSNLAFSFEISVYGNYGKMQKKGRKTR